MMGTKQRDMTFKINGMDCAEEVAVLKREVGPIVGGDDHLSFDILNGRMLVMSDASAVGPEVVIKTVARTGMRAEILRDGKPVAERPSRWQRHGRIVLTVASGLLGLLGFAVHAWLAGGIAAALGSEGMGLTHDVPMIVRLLYSVAILSGVWFVLPKAWFAAKRLRPDMNLLMTIAIAGAVVISEWFEAATVAFLFSLSLALEAWSVGRARRAVEALLSLTPSTARLVREVRRRGGNSGRASACRLHHSRETWGTHSAGWCCGARRQPCESGAYHRRERASPQESRGSGLCGDHQRRRRLGNPHDETGG